MKVGVAKSAKLTRGGSVTKGATLYNSYSLLTRRSVCYVLVATPGRLLNLAKHGYITLACVQFLVLDEAERMLDMGFMSDISRCVYNPKMPPKGVRQTLVFSASFVFGLYLNNLSRSLPVCCLKLPVAGSFPNVAP